MEITFFQGFEIDGAFYHAGRSSQFKSYDLPFETLTTYQHIVLPDIKYKGAYGVMLCKFRDSAAGRKEENIEYHTGIAVDVDQGASEELMERLKRTGYKLWIYSTAKSTAEALRIRILAPLLEPVSCEEYPIAVRQFVEAMGLGIEVDICSMKANQIMFLPEVLKEHEAEKINIYYSGRPFDYIHDWAALEAKRAVKKYAGTSQKPALIEAFLSCVSAEQVLDEMYAHRYEPVGNKYRLIGSDCPPGVYILDDGCAYSHHSSDDLFRGNDGVMHKLNAFDLFCRYYGLTWPQDDAEVKKLIKQKLPQVWRAYINN